MKLTVVQRRRLQPLTHEKILILGAGREGWSTYTFLRDIFPDLRLTVADRETDLRDRQPWADALCRDSQLLIIAGEHYLQNLERFSLIFKTPGLPPTTPALVAAQAHGVKFTSNTEWFFRLARGTIIGVTGTKGKSTTSSLIAHVLRASERPTLLLGNIGTAPLSCLSQTTSRTVSVLELSAHQLQDLTVSPHIAVVQNITSEHLDYYPDTAAYVAAKTALVRFQRRCDRVIFCDEFPNSRYFASLTPARQLPYGLKPTPEHLCFVRGHALFYRQGERDESVLNLRKVKLLGQHNRYNLMPAVIIGKQFGLENDQIATAVYSFTPLRHRLEYVATVNGSSYYNDSLSTTPEASLAALQTFTHQPIHLIAGGYERHQDYSKLAAAILKRPVKTVILLPTTGARLKRTITDLAIKKKLLVPDFFSVDDLADAVNLAHQQAQAGDVVLLSPGAASFGQFKDYAQRGDMFCQLVKNLL